MLAAGIAAAAAGAAGSDSRRLSDYCASKGRQMLDHHATSATNGAEGADHIGCIAVVAGRMIGTLWWTARIDVSPFSDESGRPIGGYVAMQRR